MSNVYSKSPLTEVTFEINFSNLCNINVNISKFYDEIKEKFGYDAVNNDFNISN